jgi:rhamnogalacturonan endolyase
MCRGYYTRTVLVAYDWRNGSLSKRWTFDSNNGYSAYAGQGNHNLSAADVDGDGKDEIIYGACAINDDGTGLYNTKLGHGDAMHVADLNPNRSGLEVWMCHESGGGSELHDAATGNILLRIASSSDVGRAMAADIDPNYPGYELWSSASGGVYNVAGSKITANIPSVNFGIWWDGDLQRELLDGNVIDKWVPSRSGTTRLLTGYNRPYYAAANNGTKNNTCLTADLFGDWREEVIWRTADSSKLIIVTTNIATDYRIHTLMHDPGYRLGVAWQNVAYNQPPHPGFYLGSG